MLIKAKINLLITLGILTAIVIGLFGILKLAEVNAGLETVYNDRVVPLEQLKKIADAYAVNIVDTTHKTRNGNISFNDCAKNIDDAKKVVDENWKAYMSTTLTPEEAKLAKEAEILMTRGNEISEKILQACHARDAQLVANISVQELYPMIDPIGEKISALIELQLKVAKAEKDKAAEIYEMSRILVITLLILSGSALFVIGTMVIRSIMKSINNVKEGFLSIQNSNDTKYQLPIHSKDEMGEISHLFNGYMKKLDAIAQQDKAAIDDIRRVSEMMAIGFVSSRIKIQAGSPNLQQAINGFNTALAEMEKATAEISRVMSTLGNSDFAVEFETGKYSGELGGMMTSLQGLSESIGDFMALLSKNGTALNQGATTLSGASNDLSGSSNTQASSLEETAAAIEELTSNISANSQKASEMASLARETEQAASEGKALADTTVMSMNEISKATQAINEAVAIIENIAFQTNILSLNAAVEAATAGEAGKGFAVVAQEVRNLANRSADAASQIKELAELANAKSKDGLAVSENMMKGFDVINQKISHTTQLVQDVANGSREQMAGINQINAAVAQLDQMTQQNASLAGEVSKLSEEILGMSQTLSATSAKTKYRKESENRVCRIDMMFETNKLKFDHVNFKNNNFGKLKESVTAWTVTNEHQCDLGKWIQAHSNESYAQGSEWNELLSNHAHVHQKVQEYINREKAGARPEELGRIAKEIENDTAKVFASLNKVRANACAQTQQVSEHPTHAAHGTARPSPTPVRPAIRASVKPAHTAPKPPVKHESDDIWESF
ncbi:MAG: methyl-accepting chemotaxis protein [Sulfuricurvum sp.]